MKNLSPIFCAGILALSSCSSDEPAENEAPVICLAPAARSIVEAQNNFSCDFFRLASAKTEEPNMVISPLSLSMALSMTANGAAGETLSEMLATLGAGATLSETNALNHLLLQSFPHADKKVKVSLANSIWIDNSFPILESFAKINKDNYNAEVYNVDIDTEDTKNRINKWAEKNTNGLIKNFLKKPLGEFNVVNLLNALYFKGEWARKFNKDNTIVAPFHNADGTETRVRMMCNYSLPVTALVDDGITAVTLPYGNKTFAMTLILPAEGMSLDECIAMIDGNRINQWEKYSPAESKAVVKLPKFEIEYGDDLSEILYEMGIKKAFNDNEADFSKLSSVSLAISSVIQKARIIVDEEGTEAAAVTHVSMETSSLGPSISNEFVFDRPFAFYISENNTSSILFMGKVTKL